MTSLTSLARGRTFPSSLKTGTMIEISLLTGRICRKPTGGGMKMRHYGQRLPISLPVEIQVTESPPEDGLKLLSTIKARKPDTQVVMLTGMGFVEDLLQEAHQKGA